MQAVLPFPDISPEIFTLSLGGFDLAIRWYGLAYVVGILGAGVLAMRFLARPTLWPADNPPFDKATLENAVFFATIGIVLGGRLAFAFFYQPDIYLADPIEILKVWRGGMAFHGGAFGVLVAIVLYALWHKRPVLSAIDLAALVAPVGLFFGRLANFINAELWGRPWDGPWAVIFPPQAAPNCGNILTEAGLVCARHPSQLYEAGLEGAVLLALLIAVALRGGLRRPGLILGLFLMGYGLARIFVEFFRVADAQFITEDNPLGHVIGGPIWGLTMGQSLSLPMVLVGLAAVAYALRPTGRPA